jgi:uncharacterized DUF497 family protein
MKYIWDLKKNEINIQVHGIDFNDAIEMFHLPMLTSIDNRKNYGEERWVGIGFLKEIIAVIIFTEDDDRCIIRIISVRKATKDESKKFKEKIGY